MDRHDDSSGVLHEVGPPNPPGRPGPPCTAWLLCLLATLDDWDESITRGRPMSLPNLLRKFSRRWADAVGEVSTGEVALWTALGRGVVEGVYREGQERRSTFPGFH